MKLSSEGRNSWYCGWIRNLPPPIPKFYLPLQPRYTTLHYTAEREIFTVPHADIAVWIHRFVFLRGSYFRACIYRKKGHQIFRYLQCFFWLYKIQQHCEYYNQVLLCCFICPFIFLKTNFSIFNYKML